MAMVSEEELNGYRLCFKHLEAYEVTIYRPDGTEIYEQVHADDLSITGLIRYELDKIVYNDIQEQEALEEEEGNQ